MTPVYFPFTYVSEPVAGILAACFRQTVVYQPESRHIPQPMKEWAQKGTLDIRVPVTADEQKLEALVGEYNAWAQVHQGNPLPFLKTQKGQAPFFDEVSAYQIQTDIRKKKEKTPPEETPDPVFSARLFLCVAQTFDIQQGEISSGLESFTAMEKELFQELRGGEAEGLEMGSPAPVSADDTGAHMTEERLRAWARLALCDTALSGLFVTSSRAVFDALGDLFPGAETVLSLDHVPAAPDNEWQEAFMATLVKASESSASAPEKSSEVGVPTEGGTARLSLCVCKIPLPPRTLLSRLLDRESPETGASEPDVTLVGLAEPV